MLQHTRELRIGATVTALCMRSMMRLVDHDKTNVVKLRKATGVDGQKFRRGKHDVDKSIDGCRKNIVALLFARFAR